MFNVLHIETNHTKVVHCLADLLKALQSLVQDRKREQIAIDPRLRLIWEPRRCCGGLECSYEPVSWIVGGVPIHGDFFIVGCQQETFCGLDQEFAEEFAFLIDIYRYDRRSLLGDNVPIRIDFSTWLQAQPDVLEEPPKST